MTFEKELEELINRYSKENGSNIPDFILAEYLNECLKNFNQTINKRDKWYGWIEKDVIKTPIIPVNEELNDQIEEYFSNKKLKTHKIKVNERNQNE